MSHLRLVEVLVSGTSEARERTRQSNEPSEFVIKHLRARTAARR